jgi:hypothetical protein
VDEAVVILTPDMQGQEVVQQGDLLSPRQMRRELQPLGVLVEHRIDDVDKRLVAVEEPNASRAVPRSARQARSNAAAGYRALPGNPLGDIFSFPAMKRSRAFSAPFERCGNCIALRFHHSCFSP